MSKYIDVTRNLGGVRLDKNLSLILKGIACLIIALHHYSQHVISCGISHNIFYHILSTQGGFSGVALFFFLSGYGLMETDNAKHKSIMPNLPLRIWKLYRPVLLMNVLQYAVMMSSSLYYGFEMEHPFIDVFRFYAMDNVFWFVGIILVCYISFYICCECRDKHKRNCLMLLGMIASISVPAMLHEATNHLMSIPFFFIGVWVSDYKEELAASLRNKWSILISGIIIVAMVFVVYKTRNSLYFHVSLNVIQTIALLYLTSWFCFTINFVSRLGQLSYPIYLVHNKILKVSNFYEYWPPVLLFVVLTLALGYIYHIILKLKIKALWHK